jgi:hypothetical protein
MRDEAYSLGDDLTPGNRLPSLDLDQALGRIGLDPKRVCYIDKEMRLPIVGLGYHVQRCDLLVHACDDPPVHGQQAFAPDGSQWEDMDYGCQHGEFSLLESTTTF